MMVSTNPKLQFSAAWLFLLSAVFILVSVSAAEERNCHWCGPLAEQVHRSRRSKSCDETNNEVTTCDPGYPYCAIVATSPPYVESRHCVKLYQDECYHIYCNTTKTWKMTCPCRGDLCNGRNTERELEAFQILPKLVAKTHRVKKAVISTNNFIKDDINRMKIVTNASENSQTNNTTNTQPINDNVLNTNSKDIDITKIQIAESSMPVKNTTSDLDANIRSKNLTLEDSNSKNQINIDMQSDEPFNDKMSKNYSSHEIAEKTIIPLTTRETATNSEKPVTAATTTKFHEMDIMNIQPTEKEAKPDKLVKSSETPTAEALQHNDNPIVSTEKVSNDTTPTTITTNDADDMYTPTIPSKNLSIHMSAGSIIFVCSLFVVCIEFV